MRCTQFIGLTEEAKKFLTCNVKQIVIKTCPHCGEPIATGMKQNIYASAADIGMFNDGPELYEYELQNGEIIREVVQAAPWSSGPCIFLCLEYKKSKNRIFEWSEEEIARA